MDETFSAVIVDPDAAETYVPETGTLIVLHRIACVYSLGPLHHGTA